MIAAAIAKPKSNPLMRFAGGGAAGRGAAEAGAALGAALFGGPATRAAGAPGGGAGAAGRAGEGGALGVWAVGGAPEAGVADAAGKVGSLIVAVGFGGKLIRTVSFLPGAGFGATGGTAPPGGGGVGTFSAIKLFVFGS